MVEENHKLTVIVFFTAYLLIGLTIYDDYGVSWDEERNRMYGLKTVDYILTGAKHHLVFESIHGRYHGPVFELLLVFLEKILRLKDSRDITLMRHLATFLTAYIGVFFFYLLCKNHFNSWRYGLTGSILLVLSPRIFSHSFYNPVDIPFMTLFIICTYTLIRFLDNTSIKNAVIHAFTCAILTDVRNIGAFMTALTYLFLALDIRHAKFSRKKINSHVPVICVYTLLMCLLTILFWPYLWENPARFISTYNKTIRPGYKGIYEIKGRLLYFGSLVKSDELPWHYTFTWILITTPLAYVFLFLVGLKSLIIKAVKNPAYNARNRGELIFMLCFFTPTITPIFLKTSLFDAWRHHYFVYPAFLLIALTGLEKITGLTGRGKNVFEKFFLAGMTVLILSSLLHTIYFMVECHPHQDTYFNLILGYDLGETERLFPVEYWGVPYRMGLEYILERDGDEKINISVANPPGRLNSHILPKEDRERLRYVELNDSKYFLSNLRDRVRHPYPEFYSVNIRGADILVVYRVDDKK